MSAKTRGQRVGTGARSGKILATEPRTKPKFALRNVWIYVALLLATFAVYAPVRHFDFVNFDDPDYVTNNLHVRGGLTAAGAVWALTSGEAANWLPLTRLSHMTDVELFGMDAGWHHLTSVAIHGAAVMLLFAFLLGATGMRWPSAFVAMVFAVHPLHVESVAWVAERKDVLSAFFWFLTLCLWVRYCETRTRGRYAAVLAAFAAGALAKPMIVTLPFVLLLLDVWPLRRWDRVGAARLIREKVPFFAVAAAAATVTYMVQRRSGAVQALQGFPFGLRLEDALISYVIYVEKTLWPTKLAVFYPYPQSVAVWRALLAGAALAGISVIAWLWRLAAPYLFTGWFWFLGTLVPVIGLVQVGAQARADRYMYVPMVGLLIAIAWGAADMVRRWPRVRVGVATMSVLACAGCAAAASVQVSYWQNSGTLFAHALKVTNGNYLAEHNLGTYLSEVPGQWTEAVRHLEAAVRLRPDSPPARTDLGNALAKRPELLPQAVAQYEAALRIEPESATIHDNLGNALSQLPGRLPDAVREYREALRIAPDDAHAHNNLGAALMRDGKAEEAKKQFEAALRIDPDYAQPRANLERAQQGDGGGTQTASAESHDQVGVALMKEGKTAEAITQFEQALRLQPDYPDAHNNLGVALGQTGKSNEAMREFETAVRLKPDYVDAQYNLGVALSQRPGRLRDAIAHLEIALRLRPDAQLAQEVQRMRAELR